MIEMNMAIWSDWFYLIKILLPRLFVVLIVAFISIRFKWFRRAMQQAAFKWRYRFILIGVFGSFASVGTLVGIHIDPHNINLANCLADTTLTKLDHNQAVVGFRDTFALIAGLVGGGWVGFGAGLLAGIVRLVFGGYASIPSSLATVLLGVFAGSIRHFRPQWANNTTGIFGVALVGTLLQRAILLMMVKPYDEALLLAWKIGVPVGVVNIAGCVLFLWIMSDLDRDRLENEAEDARLLALQSQVECDRHEQLAQQSELRALRAQVDPHFLNNTLNDLKALIRVDPDKARRYVIELAVFFNYTREFSGRNTISLREEQEQLRRYFTLQRLSLESKLEEGVDIPSHLDQMQIPPGCLITLVENALKHAFKGKAPPYRLVISAAETDANLMLRVSDNGSGICPERLALLGKSSVQSASKGGGVALYQLAQSLMLEFGHAAELNVESTLNLGTVVQLTLPKRSI